MSLKTLVIAGFIAATITSDAAAQENLETTDYSECSATLFGGAIKNHVKLLDCPPAITDALNCAALGEFMEEALNNETLTIDEQQSAGLFVAINAHEFGCLSQ